jgi:peptide/nickel transport system permease protein
MFRHILPNLLSQIVVYATVDLGNAIILTAGLSYIGLGAQAPSAEWGAMLGYARSYIYLAPWLSIFPGLAILIAVLSINLLGDGLQDALDPTSR